MKMDTGQVKRTVGGVNRDALKYSHDAHFSMEDIIHSMKEHLLDQHAYANPGSSTGTESHHHDMRFPNMKSNKENVDPTFRKQEEQTGLPREERFSSSKVQSKVSNLEKLKNLSIYQIYIVPFHRLASYQKCFTSVICT